MSKKTPSSTFTEVIYQIDKRRYLMFIILAVATTIVLLINFIFQIEVSSSMDSQTQSYFVYALVVYKVIELFLVYGYFYSRNLKKYLENKDDKKLLLQFEKKAKIFFMLVVQGNMVFGIISLKLSANIFVFLLFSLFALTTLIIVKPKKLLKID